MRPETPDPQCVAKMQVCVVVCVSLLALVSADVCPGGGRCGSGQTCCIDPSNGSQCCPFSEAECCSDHLHCCPTGTTCDTEAARCVNASGSFPWTPRTSADTWLSKSFRMIRAFEGGEEENVCPDRSRCPAEFSCLRAVTRFGCCPLPQGVSCSDGKHCCPEGHGCSADSRSCIRKETVTTVLCSDGVSECPDETTCCEDQEGKWGCCPMPKAVCCEDKIHCCPEGSTCDVQQSKCITPSRKELPMWGKLPARTRAEWENQKEGGTVAAVTATEKVPEGTTVNPVPATEEEVSVSPVTHTAAGNNVPCDDQVACPDNCTCCKTSEGEWACCPLPEAVCCEDKIHCCPKGKVCNTAAGTCSDPTGFVRWVKKVPGIPRRGLQLKDVPCDSTSSCPDNTTCCKRPEGGWACCPLPKAVCCDDHIHCCPEGTTCDLAAGSCDSDSGSAPLMKKIPASVTEKPMTTAMSRRRKPQGEEVPCDKQTSCPAGTTCCFMTSSQKYGCCPLPKAVCCSQGENCCPPDYHCDEQDKTCVKGETRIPWYPKLPAITRAEPDIDAVQCDDQSQCPEHTTCCRLATGGWGCCPLEDAVCCPDKEHCCPHGYSCNMASNSCQKVVMLQLETLPLTQVYLPEPQPRLTPLLQHRNVPCDETTSCQDGQTCCKISATQWGCCPFPNAVCCSDMLHCCEAGFTCTETGDCIKSPTLHWNYWQMFISSRKRAAIV